MKYIVQMMAILLGGMCCASQIIDEPEPNSVNIETEYEDDDFDLLGKEFVEMDLGSLGSYETALSVLKDEETHEVDIFELEDTQDIAEDEMDQLGEWDAGGQAQDDLEKQLGRNKKLKSRARQSNY